MSTEPRFHIGALVQKSKGYRYPGIIRSRHLMPGGWRYDVEADNPDFKGMLHIFSEEQLEPRAAPGVSHETSGTAYDSGATGHERQGRDTAPKIT